MKKLLAITLITSIFIACVNEIDDLTFETFKPGISFPLGQLSMTANTLTQLGDSLEVRLAESNVLEFVYEVEVLDALLDDRFSIGDQQFSDDIPFNSFLFTAGETDEVKLSQFDSFALTNSDLTGSTPTLTLALLKQGNISVIQGKDFSHIVETTILFPKITKDGQPLTISVTDNESAMEDLDGYEIDMTGVDGNQVNTIDYEISTIVTESGSSTTGTINFEFSMSSLEFSYLEGDFLSYAFDEVNAEFDLGIPEDVVPDNIRFTNPRVILMVGNSSGMEYGLDITDISVIEENDEVLQVTGSYRSETVLVARAPQLGETLIVDYTIDNNNADNLVELFSNVPKSAFFRGVATANPNGVPEGGNFISDDSRMTVDAEMILPLEGFANNYAINDTIKDIDLLFDDDGVVSLDNIDLRFQTENSFPFDLNLQLYFLDSTQQQNVIDSLFIGQEDRLIIQSGNVDDSGLVTSSNTKMTDAILTQEKYEKVKYAKSIRIKASILTSGADQNPPKTVRFTSDNALSISIGVTGNAVVDLNK
jgi:hypothetical protein